MHVDWGSTINLTCVSKFNPAPPVDVIWYHNNKVNIKLHPYFALKVKKGLKFLQHLVYWSNFMILSLQEIGFDSPRGGVSVVIEKGIDKTNSHLLIQRATSKDSGTYRCSPTNTVQAEIKIHVLKGLYLY